MKRGIKWKRKMEKTNNTEGKKTETPEIIRKERGN